ncbi:glucuronate isomerase [Pectinatus haikarae]|uniref:Uronate isomerase n=1 Tax=Pectinatus haikarae TaxID=349096 RepID=A0ABT9Y8X8_9FIRM|nr:glucuronate isomerase [Pectinatus haikarae]MDQ0203986.1 glucuronate isomerase [Pectinatus haikarae]
MSLLNEDFLLTSVAARKLYHSYAEKMPIIDYHCHLNPKDIYENKNYPNLTRIWLSDGLLGDHYKWRLERANGIPEKLITGDGDEYEKLLAWAKTIEKAIGNPLYEWTNLELKRFFGINEPFTVKNAPRIWKQANELLATEEFKPRNLIKKANVKILCTTDDPASDLHYHELLAKEEKNFKVFPAMRPDHLLNINQGNYGKYLSELSVASGVTISDFGTLKEAVEKRIIFFKKLGGRLSDHGLNSYHYEELSDEKVSEIISKACNVNSKLSEMEIAGYQTALLKLLMKLNKKYEWTMQFHINVKRNVNKEMFRRLGPDTGFDSVGSQADIVGELIKLINAGFEDNAIPQTILYSTNPNDWMALATGMQNFQGESIQRLQLGCAWWFNDTREGMRSQLNIMAQQSLLANFVGMLTDSRSFLSYPRHEYFRRVLCDLIGEWVDRGQVEENYDYLGKIVESISYNNAHNYFCFSD